MQIFILLTILVLAGCDNKKEYNMYKEMCPDDYVIETTIAEFGIVWYECCKKPTNQQLRDCIKETTNYFKELHGEFEDWDTSDIPAIMEKCNTKTCLSF